MEKPTGLIEKVIDTLHVINGINTPYSIIEKDIVLQHIRAAYIQLLNAPASEEENREPLKLPNLDSTSLLKEDETKYIQRIDQLKADIIHLTEEISEYKKSIENLETSLEENTQERSNLELQIKEFKSSNLGQKNEIESILLEFDKKEKIIEQLKKELELVLLKEDEYERAQAEEPVKPIIRTPIQEEIIPDNPIEIQPATFEVTVVEPIIETVQKPDLTPNISDVDDILEFIHPTTPKQEPSRQVVTSQPLLFVEEKEAPKQDKKSLNDLLTEQKEDNSLGYRFQQSKIIDLTKAISINDKFLFIRELFKGKGERLSSAIHKLNKCSTIEESFDAMEELKNFYFWDTTASAYLSLCDLVRRKFL